MHLQGATWRSLLASIGSLHGALEQSQNFGRAAASERHRSLHAYKRSLLQATPVSAAMICAEHNNKSHASPHHHYLYHHHPLSYCTPYRMLSAMLCLTSLDHHPKPCHSPTRVDRLTAFLSGPFSFAFILPLRAPCPASSS